MTASLENRNEIIDKNWPASDIPEGKIGNWEVSRFVVDETDSLLHRIGYIGKPGGDRSCAPGTYTRLMRGDTVVMSDTRAERRDHRYFMATATGKVLIAGLGLGCVARCVAACPSVTDVVVVERSPEVISLVWDTLKTGPHGRKFWLVQADINDYRPEKGERFDHAWVDIWDTISGDNLPEMGAIGRRISRRVENRVGYWGRDLCKRFAHEWKEHQKRMRVLYALRDKQKQAVEAGVFV